MSTKLSPDVCRLFEYVADNLGYRIVKESLYKVGAASPSASIRGGNFSVLVKVKSWVNGLKWLLIGC